MHKLRIYISYKILIFLKDFFFIQRIGNWWEEGMPPWVECLWTGRARTRPTVIQTNRNSSVGCSFGKSVDGGRSTCGALFYIVQFLFYSEVIMSNCDQM